MTIGTTLAIIVWWFSEWFHIYCYSISSVCLNFRGSCPPWALVYYGFGGRRLWVSGLLVLQIGTISDCNM